MLCDGNVGINEWLDLPGTFGKEFDEKVHQPKPVDVPAHSRRNGAD